MRGETGGLWKGLLARALNENQILILDSASKSINRGLGLTFLLAKLSSENAIALSTLKFNAHVLKKLGLIDYDGFVQATDFGRSVLKLLQSGANTASGSKW